MARKPNYIAWTLKAAGIEFGADEDTIRKRLSQADQLPDDKGHFTTRQVCLAMFGSAHTSRVELLTQQTEEKKLKNAERSGRSISIEDSEAVAGRAAAAIRERIVALSIPRDEKKALLADIHALASLKFEDAESAARREESDAPETDE